MRSMIPESAEGLCGPRWKWRLALYSDYIESCNPPRISLSIKIVRSELIPFGEGMLLVKWTIVRTVITTLSIMMWSCSSPASMRVQPEES